ncbi:MAG: hypothetical protein GY755_20620 [Chloroflexi bacterium]|nr:hypothetical protein [Chloroflexota bacterium]
MSSQSPAEEVQSDIRSLQSSLRELQGKVRLSDIRDNIEDLQTSVNGMDRRIASLREKGYAFEKELEHKAEDFAAQWAELAPNINSQIERDTQSLSRSLRPLETQIVSLAGKIGASTTLKSQVDRVKSQVEALQGRVEATERSTRGSYDQFNSDVSKVKAHLHKLEWMMKELSEASFDLLATESGIMAVKAVWAKDGKERKDDPEGVLYLTDQRLLFEQKEKIATKKVLFIATEKKLVQEKRWETPVALLEEVKARNEGFMNKDDFIDIRLGDSAPYDSLSIHIWQPADDWVAFLKRAKAKEFDATRAIEISAEEVEKVKSAPTQCPSCSGTIDQVVLRGMDTIACEYCGAVIRL